jgi:hypothetical protein
MYVCMYCIYQWCQVSRQMYYNRKGINNYYHIAKKYGYAKANIVFHFGLRLDFLCEYSSQEVYE